MRRRKSWWADQPSYDPEPEPGLSVSSLQHPPNKASSAEYANGTDV